VGPCVDQTVLTYLRRTVGAVVSATTRMDKTMYVVFGMVIVLAGDGQVTAWRARSWDA
jgi:hypothetical protein